MARVEWVDTGNGVHVWLDRDDLRHLDAILDYVADDSGEQALDDEHCDAAVSLYSVVHEALAASRSVADQR